MRDKFVEYIEFLIIILLNQIQICLRHPLLFKIIDLMFMKIIGTCFREEYLGINQLHLNAV
jgi:hypothetical protein